jgi:dihydroorotate dehydrogenase electron transfer subunit
LSGGSHQLRVAYDDAVAAAPLAQPGQFAMLLRDPAVHLVRRPMSILDEGDGWRSFMVKPVGPASRELTSSKPGDWFDVSEPLGIGFPKADVLGDGPLLLVGGGFGVAPMNFLARQLDAAGGSHDYRVLYGGRSQRDLDPEVLDGIQGEVLLSTDDGSQGFQGTCVALALQQLDALGDRARHAKVLTCGSNAMMQALFDAVHERVDTVLVSLEEIMGCGFGVCMGCVVPTRNGPVPICTHGPVFAGKDVFAAGIRGAGGVVHV